MALSAILRMALIGMVAASAAGCSSDGGLSTGTLIGGNSASAAKAPPSNNTATGRALHVGTVSARATKCGFNFDAATLRTNYLAAEAASGIPVTDLGNVERVYDTGYRGVMAGAAKDPNYCNSKRTTVIKTALNKALAGDYSPPVVEVAKDTGGGFGGFFDQDVVEKGPAFGSEEFWDKQREETSK